MLKKLISALLTLTLVVGLQANPNETDESCDCPFDLLQQMKFPAFTKPYDLSLLKLIQLGLFKKATIDITEGPNSITKTYGAKHIAQDVYLKYVQLTKKQQGDDPITCSSSEIFQDEWTCSSNLFTPGSDQCFGKTYTDPNTGNKITIEKPSLLNVFNFFSADPLAKRLWKVLDYGVVIKFFNKKNQKTDEILCQPEDLNRKNNTFRGWKCFQCKE